MEKIEIIIKENIRQFSEYFLDRPIFNFLALNFNDPIPLPLTPLFLPAK